VEKIIKIRDDQGNRPNPDPTWGSCPAGALVHTRLRTLLLLLEVMLRLVNNPRLLVVVLGGHIDAKGAKDLQDAPICFSSEA